LTSKADPERPRADRYGERHIAWRRLVEARSGRRALAIPTLFLRSAVMVAGTIVYGDDPIAKTNPSAFAPATPPAAERRVVL